jgi:hypothetical protein
LLCKHINIAEVDKEVFRNALRNSAVQDFEDGLEYYSAVKSKCNCIITDDVNDFHFSKIEVLQSEAFFEKYLYNKSRG